MQKRLTLLALAVVFTLVAMGAVSAADITSDNLTATSVDQAISTQEPSQNTTDQTIIQTLPDPQIWNGGVPVSRGGQPAGYDWGTIQNAINNALAGDTIMLENGATFSGVDNTQITINKNLIFDVLNDGTATIDGGGTRWGFYIPNGVTVTFNDITFQNFVINSYGAAIRNEGVLSVTGCTFTGNSAPYSGAIGNIGTCTVTDCTFTGNSATNNGGALANDGNLIVTGSTFTGNTAGNNGGAIASDGTLTVDESTFTGNTAASGGAISNLVIGNNIGTAQINFCRIVGNTAVNGNAIFNSNGGLVNAENNWWGTNSGPVGSNSGIVDADPWIILTLSASPSTIINGATSTLTADLTTDNDNNPVPGTLPDGIPVTFSLINGPYGSLALPLTVYTTNGVATIVFTANDPNAPHTQTVGATVDYQTVQTGILINPNAVLTVDKYPDRDPSYYNVGEDVVYTVYVRNDGPNPATGVVLTDTLPAGLTFVSATGGGTESGGVVTWNIGNLAVNGEFTALLTARVNAGTQGQTLTNRVSAVNTQNPTPVTDTSDIFVNSATLSISKTADKAQYNVGETVTYTINVTNNAVANGVSGDATGVVVTDTLPTGLTFVSASNGGVWDANTRIITWNVGNLAAGASFTPTVTATVTGEAAAKTLVNTATADSNQLDDPVSAQASIYVPSADLVLTKTVDKSMPAVKDTVIFTLMVNNNGPDTAVNVTVNDKLPAGVTYVSHVANFGTYDPSTGLWTISSLPNGASAVLTITAVVDDSGQIVNQANVTALTWDPNLDDNAASAAMNVQAEPVPVSGKTVEMQKTGAPFGALILAFFMLVAGMVLPRRK